MDAAADTLSKQLAAETQKRQRAEMLCLQEQLSAMARKCEELLVENENHKACDQDQLAILQDVLETVTVEKDELQAQLQTQNSGSALRRGVTWQYYMDGRWEEFTPEANEHMLQAYLDYVREIPGTQFVTISSGGVDRQVDFKLMQQMHLRTGKTRSIRALPGVPPVWESSVPDLLLQGNDLGSFYKEEADPEIWEAIQYILDSSGHAQDAWSDCSCMRRAWVQSVHRIENMRLWHRYRMRLDAMRGDHGTYKISVEPAELDLDGVFPCMAECQEFFNCGETLALDVDEKILLHGTSSDNADAIVREGFDHRTCQNGLYGLGVYFACAACKSHQYTCEHFKGPQSRM